MRLVLHPTQTAQWQALIQEAEQTACIALAEELESYLVFLLIRFSACPEMVNGSLALAFLENIDACNRQKQEALRDVGDQCLLFSGLFPRRARKCHVNVSYFVGLGQSAYATLGAGSQDSTAALYAQLGKHFVNLMDLLIEIRKMEQGGSPLLAPLEAHELWQATGSQQAKTLLKQHTLCTPVPSRAPKKA